MARRAVIDIGSNTIHLLVADCTVDAVAAIHDARARSVLGAAILAGEPCLGVDRITVVARAVRAFAREARRFGAIEVAVAGTYAARAAADSAALGEAITAAAGVPLWVLSEQEEAALCHAGAALSTLPDPPYLLADIGGGSTELVITGADGSTAWESLPLGSGQIAARWLTGDPPTPSAVRAAAAAAAAAVSRAHLAAATTVPEIVATGGAARRLRRQAGHKAHMRRGAPVHEVPPLVTVLLSRPLRQWPHQAKNPQRAATTRAGALILEALIARWQPRRWRTCPGGLREGLLLLRERGWQPAPTGAVEGPLPV